MSIQPLKYAKIELDDDLNPQNGILGSTNTRYDGNFNIQIQDNHDLNTLYVRVYSDSIGSIVDKVRVNDVDSSETYYYTVSISKSSFNWIDFSDGKSNDIFNIYSNILENYNYYLSNGLDSNKIIISLNKFGGDGDYIPENDYLQEPHILLKYSEYPVRNDVINHEYGHFVMDYYNVLKNNPITYLYLFDWNKIPEIDNILLINYLKQNFGITWLNSSEIKKIDNGNTIFVSTEKNHLSLKLNDEKDKINLEIDDGRTYELGVKMIDGGLIAFDKKDQNIIPKNNIAWIEGWATFASGTINDEDTLYYYEGLIISLENAKICPLSKPYCINGHFDESQDDWGRNAAFLWDVYDGKGGWDITENYDKFDGGNDIRTMLDILMDNTKIYKTDYDGTPYYHMVPLSVKEFYQYWVDNNKPQKKELDGLIKHHFKEYKEIRGFSPINIHLYNSNGDHIGLNKATGDIDREIIGSYYSGPDSHPEEIFLITGNEDENIKIIIQGTDDGTFTLTYENAFKGITSLATYENIPVNLNFIAYIIDNMNFGNNIMQMDFDGDGIIDELILPTSILISGGNLYNITFLPPIKTMDQFTLTDGSTLPIKFTARNSTTNEFIYDDTVNVTITNSTGHLITYFINGTGTDSVRINSTEEQYIVNFDTKNYVMNAGETYAITVTFGEPDSLRGYAIAQFNLIDGIPPSLITNLQSTPGTTWINLTWTNPSDPDFNHTELYLNGTFLTNIPAPQNYYNITGLLPDTSYELSACTVDINGNINLTWVNDTASTLPASGIALNLYTGWNLISLPLMPEDTSITSLLSSIHGNYSIVWEYNASNTSDHWKKYDPSAPFGNDLTTMEPGKGYWIMMTSNDTLFVTGDVPGSTDIILKAGWNLIGYNSLVGHPIENALASVSGNYSIVWAYNTSDTADHWKKYDPGAPFGNDLANLKSGSGYWIMMTSDDILEI